MRATDVHWPSPGPRLLTSVGRSVRPLPSSRLRWPLRTGRTDEVKSHCLKIILCIKSNERVLCSPQMYPYLFKEP